MSCLRSPEWRIQDEDAPCRAREGLRDGAPARPASAAVTRSVATCPHDDDTSCEAMPPAAGTRVSSGHHRGALPRLQVPGSPGPLGEQEWKERSFRGTAAWGGSPGCGRGRKEQSFRETSAPAERGREGRGARGRPFWKEMAGHSGCPLLGLAANTCAEPVDGATLTSGHQNGPPHSTQGEAGAGFSGAPGARRLGQYGLSAGSG